MKTTIEAFCSQIVHREDFDWIARFRIKRRIIKLSCAQFAGLFQDMNEISRIPARLWTQFLIAPEEISQQNLNELKKRLKHLQQRYQNMKRTRLQPTRVRLKNKIIDLSRITGLADAPTISTRAFYQLFANKLIRIMRYLQEVGLLTEEINTAMSNMKYMPQKKKRPQKKGYIYYELRKNPKKLENLIGTLKDDLKRFIEISKFLCDRDHGADNFSQIYSKYLKFNKFKLKKHRFRIYAQVLGLHYVQVARDIKNDEQSKKKRIDCAHRLIDLYNDPQKVLIFFDVTSINDKSFRKRKWVTRSSEFGYKKVFYYNATHVLMLVSTSNIESLLFYRGNISSILITHFLNNSLKKFKADNIGKQIVMVLDNAPVHRTILMKKLTGFHEIELFFPPPHNPYFNMIEFVFRHIKLGFKREYSMG
jgi:hypothetical protein